MNNKDELKEKLDALKERVKEVAGRFADKPASEVGKPAVGRGEETAPERRDIEESDDD